MKEPPRQNTGKTETDNLLMTSMMFKTGRQTDFFSCHPVLFLFVKRYFFYG